MKASMFLWILIIAVGLGACSSQKIPRDKWTDKNFRVFVSPDGLDANNYARLVQALVAKGNWVVVDRARGFDAIKREQEALHRTQSGRFDDAEKYAIWGKLYGVGAVVVAQTQCHKTPHFWNAQKSFLHCEQFLSMVDSNTGEIIAAASGASDSEATLDYYVQLAPDWNEVVEELADNYPKYFENKSYAKSLETYRGIAQEEAARQKEGLVKQKLEQGGR